MVIVTEVCKGILFPLTISWTYAQNVGYYDFVIVCAGKFWFPEDDWKLGHWWTVQRTVVFYLVGYDID